jgi:hypothetical protein
MVFTSQILEASLTLQGGALRAGIVTLLSKLAGRPGIGQGKLLIYIGRRCRAKPGSRPD